MLELEELFGQGGKLSKLLDNYTFRNDQLEMAELSYRAFSSNVPAAIEAGTGIGKSFAYLSALLLNLKDNQGERAVVATSTQALQSQLKDKDIPVMLKALDMEDLRVSILYGRGNYICKRRFFEETSTLLAENEDDPIFTLREWVRNSDTGALPDTFSEELSSRLLEFTSDADECIGKACPFSRKGECFFLKARERAKESSLVITNQTLMLLDARNRDISEDGFDTEATLPGYSYLVVDEAHHIEEQATECFSDNYSKLILDRYIRKISGRSSHDKLPLLTRVKEYANSPDNITAIVNMMLELSNLSEDFELELKRSFDGYVSKQKRDRDSEDRSKEVLLLSDYFDEYISELRKSGLSLSSLISKVSSAILLSFNDESDYNVTILKNYARTLSGLSIALDEFLNFDSFSTKIPYLTLLESGSIEISIAPMETGPILDRVLVTPLNSVLYCSATIALNENFDFFIERAGLKSFRTTLIKKAFPSPFDYGRNLLIIVPTDGVDYSEERNKKSQYEEYLTNLVSSSIEITGGGALILFTSYEMMNNVYRNVENRLGKDYRLLLQNSKSTKKILLKSFKEDKDSSLFATSSFWEGVDVQGESLRLLIISKLPFQSPSDPIYKARLNYINNSGGRAFELLQLPDCILSLKQGIGRLIRNENDKGVVIIADNRLITKSYRSLIKSSIETGENFIALSLDRIPSKIEDFLY